jgi:hypothetical protein
MMLTEDCYKEEPKHAGVVSAVFGNLLIYVFIIRFTYIHFTKSLDEAMDCEDRLTSDFI